MKPNRSALRAAVFGRDGGRCLWPKCGKPAVELSHFHSIGAGGRKSADTMDNAGAMCRSHARISDGEFGPGGADEYRLAHLVLLGPAYWDMPSHRVGWERAEALTQLVSSITLGREGGNK